MSRATTGLYEFGPFRLDLERRVLSREHQALPLPPKTFDLLVLLVQSPGHAFSKQELMNALWRDTFVEEGNLSFQIAVLRKALREDGARWVETVPKHGYRFSGDVRTVQPDREVQAEGGSSTESPTVPARLTRVKSRWIAVMTAVAIGISLYVALSKRKDGVSSTPKTQAGAVPLTAYEGEELMPSLSPDGSQVAFSWNGTSQDNEDIYVKLVGPGEPIRLTTHPARDASPAWSPDGQNIAFLRWARRNDSDVDIMLVPALGNAAERRLASATIRPTTRRPSRLAWTPDGRWLAIDAALSPEDSYGIWLLSPDGQQRRRLLTETDGAIVRVGVAPAFSFDGRHLAFIRKTSTSVESIYVLPLSADMTEAGPPVAVTDQSPGAAFTGLVWTDNDHALMFTMAGDMAPQSRLYRLAMTPDRMHVAGASQMLPFGDQAHNLTVSRSGRLVYSAQSRDSAIWRVDLTQPGSGPLASGIPGSTFDEHTPSYSRDGKRVAFASTRTGTEELWVANADGTGLRQVTFIGGAQCANPQWSPTSDDIILFNSRLHGSSDLFLLDLSTGRYDRLTTDRTDEQEGRWSLDGESIYFGSNRTGRDELWKMPAAGGPAVPITQHGGVAGTEADDGFIYYAKTALSPSSIWRVAPNGGEETLVIDGLSYSLNFAVGHTAIYLMSRGNSANDTAIERFDLVSRARTRLATIGKRWWFGVALSPDEKSFLYSVVDGMSSNLMLVEKAW